MREPTRDERKLVQLELKKSELEIQKLQNERDLIDAQPQRRGEFLLRGPIDELAVHVLMEKIDIWSTNHPAGDITIVINSQGGVAFDCWALMDYLEQIKLRGHKITTIGLGMIASAASLVFQAGDERIMGKRAWMLIHEVQGVVAGSFSKMEDDMKLNSRLCDQALDIYCKRAKLSRAAIKKRWQHKDWWLDGVDAVKDGFADSITEDAPVPQ